MSADRTRPPIENRRRSGDIDKRIGQWIRERRLALGLTQQEMGDRIGVTYQQLHKYERGINRLSIASLLKICQLAASDMAEFQREITSQAPLATVHPRANSQAHARFAALSDAQQNAVFILAGIGGDTHA